LFVGMLSVLKLRPCAKHCASFSVRYINLTPRYSSSDIVKTTTASSFQSLVLKEKQKFLSGEYGYLSSPYKSVNHLKELNASVDSSSFKGFQIEPQSNSEKWARKIVNGWIYIVDVMSGFKYEEKTKAIWISKLVLTHMFLPNHSLAGAMVYHTKSVCNPGRDTATVSWYLANADNLRHSFVALLEIKNPNLFYRLATSLAQLIDLAYWAISMFPAPRWNHRMVAYMLEDAIVVLNKCIAEIEAPNSSVGSWKSEKAPQFAVDYYGLKDGESSVKDMLIAIREETYKHLVLNHVIASISNDEMRPLRQ